MSANQIYVLFQYYQNDSRLKIIELKKIEQNL